MKKTLAQFVSERGQSSAASLLGLTQPGIRKALSADREIYIIKKKGGKFEGVEIRPFPVTKKSSKA